MADAVSTKRARVIPPVEPGPNTVGTIFRVYGDEWLAGHALSYRQRQAFVAIRACRTAAMGTRADVCEDCGTIRLSYGSCGDRHCPLCQSLARHRWLTAREAELLPVAYFHNVFTLPHEYNELIPYNAGLMYDLLFHASAAALLRAGLKELGVTLGVTGLLHTWDQRLQRHVHVHYIVTGGGLDAAGHWHAARSDRWLLDVRELMKAFRKSLSLRLKRAYTQGRLKLPPHLAHLTATGAFAAFVKQVASKKWEVYLKPPFAGPEQVLQYVAGYTHRVAISNPRIESVADGVVTFRWRDRRDGGKEKLCPLPAAEFIDRFMQHILPRQFTKIRYFGFLAGRDRRAHLAAARAALGVDAKPRSPGLAEYAAHLAALTGQDLTVCPVCGGRLRLGMLPQPWRQTRRLHLAPGPPESTHAHAA
jgi:hypothetical protein